MNKKPVLFRSVIAVVIIAVFAFGIYPLKPLNFYNTLEGLAEKHDKKLEETITLAKKIEKDKGEYPSIAMEQAANRLGTDLSTYITLKNSSGNRDIIGFVKRKAASSIRLGLDLNGGIEILLELEKKAKDNLYSYFDKQVVKHDDNLKNLFATALKIEKEKDLSSADAISKASQDLNVNLADYLDEKDIKSSQEAIDFIKKKMVAEQDATSFSQLLDAARETYRNRLEKENIFEAEISLVGDRYISIKAPTKSKEENQNLIKIIEMSARLEFKLVHKQNRELVRKYLADPENFTAPAGYVRMEEPKSKPEQTQEELIYFVKKRPEMRGKGNIAQAFATTDRYGQREISLRFTSAGSEKFARLTTKYVGRQLAIVLDGTLYSAPNLREAITGGQARITGAFSMKEASRIAQALMSGELPKSNIIAIFETNPTLGAEAVKTGTLAGLYGLIVVVLFMLIYYLRAGFVANIALLVNVVMIMGSLAAFGATLTLPGIAGIVLTIGMAVDANVLIFERIREELDKKKNLLTAIDTGYSRAFITIFDSNLTTLFVALILYWQGTGPIKGFAVTLSIGIVTSMFTSLFLTRLVFDLMARVFNFKSMKMLRLFAHPNINFLGMKNIAFTISGLLIVLGIVAVSISGKSALGIDFTGGTRLTFDYNPDSKRPSQAAIKKLLEEKGFDSKVSYKTSLMQDASEKLEIILRKKAGMDTGKNTSLKMEIQKILNAKFPDAKIGNGNETFLGALIGMQFTWAAIIAIIMAIIGIIIYISIRFEFAFAIAAIIAIIHDIAIATGLFILCGLLFPTWGSGELSLPVIAALLTIMGYSLNDTIVVFDRIREDIGLVKNKSYKEIINLSVNQTLSRTVLTSLTTLMVLIMLYASGVAAINDFVLVMIIGIVVGTYSSIFIASPIVSVWHKRIGANVKE